MQTTLDEQIVLLDAEITANRFPERYEYLCAAFQALNWARSPDAFASPISMQPDAMMSERDTLLQSLDNKIRASRSASLTRTLLLQRQAVITRLSQ